MENRFGLNLRILRKKKKLTLAQIKAIVDEILKKNKNTN